MSRARVLADRANQNTLAVDTTNSEVGIASTVPSATLDVRGEVKVGTAVQLGSAGVVTATSFSGSGESLTGVVGVGTLNVRTESLTVSGPSTFSGGSAKIAVLTDSTSTSTGALIVDGGAAIAKNVYIGAGLSVAGTLTYEDVTSVDSVGLITAKSGVNITGGQLTVGSGITMGIAGVSTFSGTADVHLLDNVQLNVGDGSDLAIYHNGSTSFIVDGADDLRIRGNAVKIQSSDGHNCAQFLNDSSVDLYYNNSKKFETTNDGTVTTGIGTFTGHIQFSGTTSALTNISQPIITRSGSSSGLYPFDGYGHLILQTRGDGTNRDIVFATGTSGANKTIINSSGNLGINTTNPNHELTVFGDEVNFRLTHDGSTNKYNALYLHVNGTGAEFNSYQDGTGTKRPFIFKQYDTERARIDSSGRLMVGTDGTTVAGLNAFLQVEGLSGETGSISVTRNSNDGGGPYLMLAKSRGTSDNSETIVQTGDRIGTILFNPADGGDKAHTTAQIAVEIDGTPGANDIPGRIIFATTADGANTVTERLRITSTGAFQFSNGALTEKCNITAGKLSDNTNIDLADGMIHYFTTQESTTSTPNIRVSSAVSLNDIMTAGDVITVTLITTAAAGGYSANWTIDGNAVTEEWVGGSAPSAGGSDGLDIYVLTIICTHASNTGDSGFKVIANLTNAT